MISPTVFLTAAHCDLGRARVFVTFDSVAGGSLDALRVGQPFTSVGCGGQEPVNPQGPGGPFIAYQDTREFAGGPNFIGAGSTDNERDIPPRYGAGAVVPGPIREASIIVVD